MTTSDSLLSDCTWDNTPTFSLDGHACWARVVDVYDGDSLTLILPFKGDAYKVTCRLAGLDTAELTSKRLKEQAKLARAKLVALVTRDQISLEEALATPRRKALRAKLHQRCYTVWAHFLQFDRYGRPLVRLYLEEEEEGGGGGNSASDDVSAQMLAGGYAYAYHGKTKLTEEEQAQVLRAPETCVG
jgi:endonuclease YncB( thermonuclease family)